MNIIKINNESFRLPHEPEKINSVLNHLDMVKKGISAKGKTQYWVFNC